jgi:hypothetical protein
MECYKHPERAAAASCVVCQQTICETCREWVAGYATCRLCADRERIRRASAAARATDAPEEAASPPGPRGPARLGRAILSAGMAAVAGALLWDRLALWTGGGLTILAVAIGWSVGAALRVGGAGRPGPLFPWVGAAAALIGIFFGLGLVQMTHEFRLRPELSREVEGVPLPLQILLFSAASPSKLGLLDWLFVYLGVFAGWRAARGRGNRASLSPAPSLPEEWEEVPVAAGSGEPSPPDRPERPPFPAAPPPPMGPPRDGEGMG